MKLLYAAATAYLLIAIACFGPAQVESELAVDADYAQCRAEQLADKKDPGLCIKLGAVGGPFKALLWPLWLSYELAKRTSNA